MKHILTFEWNKDGCTLQIFDDANNTITEVKVSGSIPASIEKIPK